jgi:hypothetical protein
MQQRAPAVYRWVARMWDTRRGDLQCAHHSLAAGRSSAHSASSGAGACALGLHDVSTVAASTATDISFGTDTDTEKGSTTATGTGSATESAHACAEATSGVAGPDECACVRMCPAGTLPAEWDSLFPQIAQYLRCARCNR